MSLAPEDWAIGFMCALCGRHPKRVVLDGTQVICRNDLIPPLHALDDETLCNSGRSVSACTE